MFSEVVWSIQKKNKFSEVQKLVKFSKKVRFYKVAAAPKSRRFAIIQHFLNSTKYRKTTKKVLIHPQKY